MQEQLNKLEWRVDQVEEAHKDFKKEHDSLVKDLADIARIIFQIKWLMIGAISYSVLTEFGIVAAIKTAIKL